MRSSAIAMALGLLTLAGTMQTHAEERPMGFFVTSVGTGRGGDLGGLEGADAHYQKLAAAASAGNREWRAYLSTEAPGKRGVFARHRIGNGPWYNARGILIAANVTDLHLHNKTITRNRLSPAQKVTREAGILSYPQNVWATLLITWDKFRVTPVLARGP